MTENVMGRKALKQDIGVGAVVAVFGTAAFINTFIMPASAVLFPRIVTVLLMLLGIALIGVSLRNLIIKKYPQRQSASLSTFINPTIAFLLLIGYVILINTLGFYSATALFLIAFMYFMNVRSWKTFLLTTVILIGFIYLLFGVGLNVNLPAGLLI